MDLQYLLDKGFLLLALLDTGQLQQELKDDMHTVLNHASSDQDAEQYQTYLLLCGHAGTELWQNVKDEGWFEQSADPIDAYSAHWLNMVFQRYQKRAQQQGCEFDFQLIFPALDQVHAKSIPALNLQALGKSAGWHHTSPFMVGIHPHYGTWYAYRGVMVFSTNADLNQLFPELGSLLVENTSSTSSPCVSCSTRPCIAACPADALQQGFNAELCHRYRLEYHSLCEKQCIARQVCPLGTEFKYSDEQQAYHYGVSLKMLKQYYPEGLKE